MTNAQPITHELDGIAFRLAQPANLSFIQQFGRVFHVFDDNDSGNISFGIHDGHQKRFIKLAGGHTINAVTTPEQAVALLRHSEQIYRDLAHPHLVRFRESLEYGDYFGLVFDWTEGGLLRSRVETQHLQRFKALPLDGRLAAFNSVIDFVQHTHAHGYVCVDIYDASLMYDFERRHLTICDIDCFEPQPLVNTMGRMWGSTRFMSPEEFELGAPIDEITNVYTLGAIAFLLFGNEQNRTQEAWEIDDRRFMIAQRATRDEREDRFQSIAEFAQAWRSS